MKAGLDISHTVLRIGCLSLLQEARMPASSAPPVYQYLPLLDFLTCQFDWSKLSRALSWMCDYKELEGEHLSTVAEELLVSAVHLSVFASKFEKMQCEN